MMSIHRFAVCLTASISIVFAGCGGGVLKDDISSGYALWTRAKITKYSFVVEPYGFMLPQKYRVQVFADGTSTVIALGDTPPPYQSPVFRTMDSLYIHLRDVRQNGGISTVKFDEKDGHIAECYVDPYKQIADDEVSFKISDFTRE